MNRKNGLLLIVALILISCQPSEDRSDLSWAEGIVWYQIFPERFANGLQTNDPKASEVPNAELQPGWQVHPWTSDWYKQQPWERAQSDTFYHTVFTRRYGGDLIGVIERLDYLENLGVEGIYFNPVFEAPSLHKYDAASYHHIDGNFGPAPKRDMRRIAEANETDNPATWIWTSADSAFLRLLDEAHKRGIKVVIDGVFNHTGTQFFAMQDIKEKGQDSPYAHWYEVTSWDDPGTPENEFDYEGWWGYKGLPVINEDANGIVDGPKQYFFAITERWMDPNGDGDPSDGIDGWRLDVINEVAPPFWRDWYQHVKSINPQAITVAEIWDNAGEWIADDRVDATMNYLLAKAVKRFFIDRDSSITSAEFQKQLTHILDSYDQSTNHILWNLMDSHDTDRLPSMIVNPDSEYDQNNSPRWNPEYNVRKPTLQERQMQKQIAAFQLTFLGAPMIYYGDEAGMWGADDPDDRKPMTWPDMEFTPETHHPLAEHSRSKDSVGFNRGFFEYYRQIIALRQDYPALKTGNITLLRGNFGKDVFTFTRSAEEQQAVVVFNRDTQSTDVSISSDNLEYNSYGDPLEGQEFRTENGALTIPVPSQWFTVLISE